MSLSGKSAGGTRCIVARGRDRALALFVALLLLWSQQLMLGHAVAMAASPGSDVCTASVGGDSGDEGGGHHRHCDDCCCCAARLDSVLPGSGFVPPRPVVEYVRATPARAVPAVRVDPYRSPPSRAPPVLL